MEKLLELFREWKGEDACKVERLPGAGSNRKYYRMTDRDGGSVVGVVGEEQEENQAFVYLSRHLRRHGIHVPEVYAVSRDTTRYIQEDLGDTSLFDALKSGREAQGMYSSQEKELLKRVIKTLPCIQTEGAKDMEWENCYPQPAFDTDSVMFDLNYFKYCFLKPSGIAFNEVKLEADFRLMAEDLTAEGCKYFMYRDFQARNIMLDAKGNPHFIDFQGGRRGPLYYDLASFLWQASAKYPECLRNELIDTYYDTLGNYTEQPERKLFNNRLSLFVLFRIMQVLGAYGFRGYFERKKHFLDSIPPAIGNLRKMIADKVSLPYPYLTTVLERLAELPQPTEDEKGMPSVSRHEGKGPLVVRVFSFSYKKGIPEDESGNGGGYVFDCRSTHNPGRYERYKQLTGMDEPVIKFLEDDGEILTFVNSIYKLADHHVERYMERGFTNLMFSFGCTGGQHRSVYCAQHLAEHINRKHGVEVRLCHREQRISRVLEAIDHKKQI